MPSHKGASPVFQKVCESFSRALSPVLSCAAPCTRGSVTLQPHIRHRSGGMSEPHIQQELPVMVGSSSPPALLWPLSPLPACGWAEDTCLLPRQPCIGGTPLAMCLFIRDFEHSTAACVFPGGFKILQTA